MFSPKDGLTDVQTSRGSDAQEEKRGVSGSICRGIAECILGSDLTAIRPSPY